MAPPEEGPPPNRLNRRGSGSQPVFRDDTVAGIYSAIRDVGDRAEDQDRAIHEAVSRLQAQVLETYGQLGENMNRIHLKQRDQLDRLQRIEARQQALGRAMRQVGWAFLTLVVAPVSVAVILWALRSFGWHL